MKTLTLLLVATTIVTASPTSAAGYAYYRYPGWYGPSVGIYFGVPGWWGPYPYPGFYPYPRFRYSPYYAYPGPYPYPLYPGPTVYIERPRVIAVAPPPPPVARAPERSFERYTLSAKELFAFDSAELKLPQPKLDEIAVALVRNRQITGITITGYTDRLGTDSYNLGLSQRRAQAVKSYLVGKGVAGERLLAIGKGEANPLVQCHEASRDRLIACLEPNRRVEIAPFTIERPIG